MIDPEVRRRTRTVLSPWVTIVERALPGAGGTERLFHSLEVADYVTVLAETPQQEVVLVEQYRPALEAQTIELPGGLLEAGEEPPACAARELAEEAGFLAAEIVPLGRLAPDTGRLENRLWCFQAMGLTAAPDWRPEGGVRRLLVPKAAFIDWVRSGRFDHALHVAALGLAMLRGRF